MHFLSFHRFALYTADTWLYHIGFKETAAMIGLVCSEMMLFNDTQTSNLRVCVCVCVCVCMCEPYNSIGICIYKDKGFCLYIYNNKIYYTKSNKQSLKHLSCSILKTWTEGELRIGQSDEFQSLTNLLL